MKWRSLTVDRIRFRLSSTLKPSDESHFNGVKPPKIFPSVSKSTVRVFARPSHRRWNSCPSEPSRLHRHTNERGDSPNSANITGQSEMIGKSSDGTGGDGGSNCGGDRMTVSDITEMWVFWVKTSLQSSMKFVESCSTTGSFDFCPILWKNKPDSPLLCHQDCTAFEVSFDAQFCQDYPVSPRPTPEVTRNYCFYGV
jgi:hypothetical protein